ncbi:MAG: BolA/IbaG family iron-sulfur metabolism protein [Acidiferrobacterales bacterium]|nr:BolA/IbaG family iron-sulfur metabolism protein [Acidiferrobacterales bacterium]
MVVQNQIRQKLTDALAPVHLEVINESSMHSVPPGSESHFKVVAVSDEFQDQSLIFRHRMINDLLADEIAGPIHALSLHAMTPDEWKSQGNSVADSPLCRGGSKLDKTS